MGKELKKIEKEGETLLVSGDVNLEELDTDSLVETDDIEETEEAEYYNENISHIEIRFLATVLPRHNTHAAPQFSDKEISGVLDKRKPFKKYNKTDPSGPAWRINLWIPTENAFLLGLVEEFTVKKLQIKHVFEVESNLSFFVSDSLEIIEIDSGMALCELILT